MIERPEHSIVIRESTDLTAAALFAVLADPDRHTEIDGSGMLRGADPTSPRPITAVGEVFTMRMHHPSLGDYTTDNTVLEFEQDRAITWTTARTGNEPAGVRWSWRFDSIAEGAGGTAITHGYDWSQVTDPAVLARVSFPRVQPDELAQTVQRLITAAGG